MRGLCEARWLEPQASCETRGAGAGGRAEHTQRPAPDPLTFHRLLQELGNLVCVLGVQGGGEDKLALRLHEILPEQLPASGKRLTHQGLVVEGRAGRERGRDITMEEKPELRRDRRPCVTSHHAAPDRTAEQGGPMPAQGF